MSDFSFIPENSKMDEKRVEQICRAFLNTPRSVYDGRNRYAAKSGVHFNKEKGRYYFSNDDSNIRDLLFYPSTAEIRTALAEFKAKGYYPYYDNEVCEYGYVSDPAQIRGAATLRHIEWL